MENKKHSFNDVLRQLPSHLREAYELSQRGIHKVRVKKRSGGNPTNRKFIAPLVQRLAPNTVVGASLRRGGAIEEPFMNNQATNEIQPETKTFVINGYEAFFDYIKNKPTFHGEAEITSFIQLMNNISKACPCSRNQLRDSARDLYARMLPVIQARSAAWFSLIKQDNAVEKLIFKEGDLVLLEV